jgi:hypothetical protein
VTITWKGVVANGVINFHLVEAPRFSPAIRMRRGTDKLSERPVDRVEKLDDWFSMVRRGTDNLSERSVDRVPESDDS